METTVVFIPIKRETIRRNPNAGGFRETIPGLLSIDFSYPGDLPSSFKKRGFVITCQAVVNGVVVECSGISTVPIDADLIALITLDNKITVNMRRDVIDVTPMYQPEYLFDYENPSFRVKGLGEIQLSDLTTECNDDGCWLEHRGTGKVVDVILNYENVEDALVDIT